MAYPQTSTKAARTELAKNGVAQMKANIKEHDKAKKAEAAAKKKAKKAKSSSA